MGKHFQIHSDMEPTGRYPSPVDFMKITIIDQNSVFRMVFGAEHYPGAGDSMYFLLLRNEDSPEFFTAIFPVSIWGRMAADYIRKVTEAVRFSTHLGSKSDGAK